MVRVFDLESQRYLQREQRAIANRGLYNNLAREFGVAVASYAIEATKRKITDYFRPQKRRIPTTAKQPKQKKPKVDTSSSSSTAKSSFKQKSNMAYGKYSGVYGGKFRPGKKTMKQNYHANLSTEQSNNSITPLFTGAATYVGHGFSTITAFKTVMMSIVQRLFHYAGFRFSSFDDQHVIAGGTTTDYIIYVYHIPTSGTVVSSLSVPVLRQDTYMQITAKLVTAMYGLTNDEDRVFTSVELFENDAGLSHRRGQIELQHAFIKLNYYSCLKIQNQTTGNLTTDTEATDVSANPLQGKIYMGNGDRPMWRYVDAASLIPSTSLAPSRGGIIVPVAVQWTAQMQNQWRRPFSHQMLGGVHSTSKMILEPGQIKKHILSDTRTISFTGFISKCLSYMSGPGELFNSEKKTHLGKFALVGVEKMCSSGTDVSLSVECDQTYRASIYVKKMGMATTMEVY